jgi:zinc protease
MIHYNEFELSNGLKVLVHEDKRTPLASVNILYNVGSKDESIEKTGFAHLFEHFMFEGSKNIKHFDSELQKAGGDNNAFTSNDITNYYCSLPAVNLETAFWLESDRMLELDFNQKSLDTQISVVCEEFKENYINKPYGDIWHLLCDLAYTKHPYKWPTIGLKLEHIQAFTLQETKDFFFKYYRPNNAILSVSGGVSTAEVERLAKKWFGSISAGEKITRSYAKEPKQQEKRKLEVNADVPVSAIFKAYHICDRLHDDFYATDLLSDLLGSGASSRLYQQLVKEKQTFSDVNAYISGTDEEGILVIDGKLSDEVSTQQAEHDIQTCLDDLLKNGVGESELQKATNRTLNYLAFSNESHTNKSFNLSYFKMLDRMDLLNEEKDYYQKVSTDDMNRVAGDIFKEENSSVIYYEKNS